MLSPIDGTDTSATDNAAAPVCKILRKSPAADISASVATDMAASDVGAARQGVGAAEVTADAAARHLSCLAMNSPTDRIVDEPCTQVGDRGSGPHPRPIGTGDLGQAQLPHSQSELLSDTEMEWIQVFEFRHVKALPICAITPGEEV